MVSARSSPSQPFERFARYDAAELARCGQACVNAFAALLPSNYEKAWAIAGTAVWTDTVLDWFADVHADDVVVDTSVPSTDASQWKAIVPDCVRASRQRQGEGEFLKLDLVASRGPRYTRVAGRSNYWTEAYWQSVVAAESAEPLLALESEWKGKTSEERYVCVMHAAIKLAWVRTRAKVLVFASRATEPATRQRVAHDVGQLRVRSGDRSPWLMIDLPEGSWSPGELQPSYRVVAEPSDDGSWTPAS